MSTLIEQSLSFSFDPALDWSNCCFSFFFKQLLKALPVLQQQIDALLEVDVCDIFNGLTFFHEGCLSQVLHGIGLFLVYHVLVKEIWSIVNLFHRIRNYLLDFHVQHTKKRMVTIFVFKKTTIKQALGFHGYNRFRYHVLTVIRK